MLSLHRLWSASYLLMPASKFSPASTHYIFQARGSVDGTYDRMEYDSNNYEINRTYDAMEYEKVESGEYEYDVCYEKHNNAMMISWTTAEDVAFEFTTRLRMTKMELKMTSMKMTTTMLGMMSMNYYL